MIVPEKTPGRGLEGLPSNRRFPKGSALGALNHILAQFRRERTFPAAWNRLRP
jgi:hypothetical protein